MIWLRIAGTPPRQFYRDARTIPHLEATEARHELLIDTGTLRSSVEGETSGVTVTLRNRAGECARLLAVPPLGSSAQLRDETGSVFEGIVSSVEMGDGECRIEVQA